ncbi:hypothetical protein BsWGS_12137 [Bradybaena similaris]
MLFQMHYVISLSLVTACSAGNIIDLSHKHGPSTYMTIFGNPGYNLTTLVKGSATFGFYIELNYYGTSEHGGTHIDAPSHFAAGGIPIDEIPIEHTILDGVMLDFSQEAALNHEFAVSVQRLKDWEKEHGKIPKESAVLFYFGWYQKFNDETHYRGTRDYANPLTYRYPYVTIEAARWLLDERGVRAYGSDTLSVDPFQINDKHSKFPIHVLVLPQNRIIVENLRDLDKLPPRNFRFHFSPVKYVGASGTQVRAYGITYDAAGNGAGVTQLSSLVVIVCVAHLISLVIRT